MELKLNLQAVDININNSFKEIMNNISDNLKNGKRETEIYIDKEISSEVIELINKEIKDKDFVFLTVDRRANEFTGKMQSFWGMTIGNQKFYKLRYNGK